MISIFVHFLIIVCLLFLILFFMFLLDHKIWLWKVKNYLIICSDLEKEILKTFVKNPQTSCPLTNNHNITLILSNLSIIIKSSDVIMVNNQSYTQSNYYINNKIYQLISKDLSLKNIYLSI